MMEEESTSEMSVNFYETIQRNNTEFQQTQTNILGVERDDKEIFIFIC
jgi:hypothetical protein